MQQLLQIESIPIKLTVESTRARFEVSDTPQVDNTRTINSSAYSPRVSTAYSADTSVTTSTRTASDVYVGGQVSYADMLSYEAYGNGDSAYSANRTATSTSSTYAMAAIRNAQINRASTVSAADTQSFVSSNMQAYSADRANFEMSVGFGLQDMEFIPASIKFTVDQRPEVKIEYIGGPIYVPKSADPNYVDITA
jgi:hypothetical protein